VISMCFQVPNDVVQVTMAVPPKRNILLAKAIAVLQILTLKISKAVLVIGYSIGHAQGTVTMFLGTISIADEHAQIAAKHVA